MGSFNIVCLSMVVSASADVLVVNGWRSRLGASRRRSIEAPLQDGFDVPIGASPHTDCSATCCFDPIVAVALGESQAPEARAEALLWVRSLSQDLVGKLACCAAEFSAQARISSASTQPALDARSACVLRRY